ncbi:hypothetical protein [Qipengyuania nanhaisediminis]|uniref:hypothetical protein n=1 Tax=Qipengyuania nanhaisediminis TaxID=604088 RepID=UPI0038B27DAE
MPALTLHPSCPTGPITGIDAAIRADEMGCEATFRLVGDVSKVVMPQPAKPERMDDLWKTTCCEIFWQPRGGSSYREFNLSPSTRWAAYDFDDFREGMRDAPVESINIETASNGEGAWVLNARIAAALPAPADVALNAIIELPGGRLQFWALAFPPGKAEFHSETCRQAKVERK